MGRLVLPRQQSFTEQRKNLQRLSTQRLLLGTDGARAEERQHQFGR